MTEKAVERFRNYVDGPKGELWSFRVRSDHRGAQLRIGETHRDEFDIMLSAAEAAAFSAFMRSAADRGGSAFQSVDSRNGEWAGFFVNSVSDGRWRLMFSRRGGDVELHVDASTMQSIVEAVAQTI